jgi:hypothetical protein
MRKFLLLIFFSLFWSNVSFADQVYSLIQVNCYEKSGYFELRKIGTQNLNMWEISEDENLINLEHSESVTKKCVFPKDRFVDEQITIMVAINPYCKIKNEWNCLEKDAEFDIWYIDGKGKHQFIEKGKFAIGDDKPDSRKRITQIEYLPKDLYFVIHFEENTAPGDIMKKFLKKEIAIFLPDSFFSSDYKYPITYDDLVKMF